MAQFFSLGHIHTMSKSRRIILLATNIVMCLAGLYALIGFFGLTDQHATYGFRPGHSHSPYEVYESTNILNLQTMGAVAAWNWDRFTLVIDTARWAFLALAVVLIVGSIIHLWLTPRKTDHDHVA
jgi:hypothetical protein